MAAATAPYGSWRSPLTAETIARGGVNVGYVQVDGKHSVYWLEQRPAEDGRYVIVRSQHGTKADAFPRGFNARNRVHEYGGGAYAVTASGIYFTNFEDQRLYRIDDEGGEPTPITPQPSIPGGVRFADMRPLGPNHLVAVRESHYEKEEAVNEIVSVVTDGSGKQKVLVSGADFYSYPRVSLDGSTLAWISWNHPCMPWDGAELWAADITSTSEIGEPRKVAGGTQEAIFQPEWSPDGKLHYVSDRSGWWNIYCEGDDHSLAPMEAEFADALWIFGMSTYTFLSDGRIVCMYVQNGESKLGILDSEQRTVKEFSVDNPPLGDILISDGERVYYDGGSRTCSSSIVSMDPNSGKTTVLAESNPADPDYLSTGVPITFPTTGGKQSHGFLYLPENKDFEGPSDELPPLLVFSHGGPTGHSSAGSFRPQIQFWTSRGVAVVDVNYGGSTGYGREYRRRLNGQWGVVDTDDCIAAARFLVAEGKVDPERLAIRGGSAGGYTTLCALTFHDFFGAGANYFGVADLKTFIADTHKFESRYLDGLVGPYPEAEELYFKRSPTNFPEKLNTPMIVFQGLEDKIVPPRQSEQVVEALKKKGLPYAYFPFEGEQHGFRRAENIIRSLEAELYFYGKIFGFEPADEIEPFEIHNLK